MKLFLVLVFCPLVFCRPAEAETNSPVNEPVTNPGSLLVSSGYGPPFHMWSERLYSNFELATLSLTYEKESGLWPFTKNKELVKSFLLELQLSRIWGKGIELEQDQVSQETWDKAVQEGRSPTVDWDHYQIALVPYYRFYYPLGQKVRLYFEAGFGLALLNKPLIEDGTIWNFLINGGFGLDFKFKRPFTISLKLQHFSNGGDAQLGITDKRVIGPENLMFGFGMRFPL
ncbi:MAG: acyloxyacyl hydrolase [Deltaproteobacteria bacterium]|nr:acyloxyacyl hydrolase [Deltaproteobacteria bacterium]